jgi:hypothetical protein
MKPTLSAVAFALFSISQAVSAQAINLPLQLDYGLINKLVANSLYKGAGNTVELWQDAQKCSSLKLANLKIDGKDQQIHLANDVHVQLGTKLGGQCIPILNWQGVLETLQQPLLNAGHTVLSLPVTQALAYDQQGHQINIKKLQDLLKSVVEPKLAGLSIDLNSLHKDMARKVSAWLPKQEAAEVSQMLNTLTFTSAEANDRGIALQLAMDAPARLPVQAPSAALTAAEQVQWQAIWKNWQSSLSKAINNMGQDEKNQGLQATLNTLLQASGTAFQAGLTGQGKDGDDPVRTFFSQSWEKLTPQLKQFSNQMPGLEGFNYLGLIAATDVLYQLENTVTPLGITFTSDGLRKLVRLLIAGKRENAQAQLQSGQTS